MKNTLTREQIASVAGLTSREAAAQLGVKSKSTINRYRAKYDMREDHGDRGITDPGVIVVEAPAETMAEANQALASRGIDASEYDVSYTFSDWDAPDGTVKHSSRVVAKPKPSSVLEDNGLDVAELFKIIENDPEPLYADDFKGTLVVAPADWQIGKTDYESGTPETLALIRQSLSNLVARIDARDKPYENIVLAEMGDIVENFYNTSSQRETNDLDMTSQIRVARRMVLEVIRELAPRCDNLYYVTVPSNHGAVRVGFKAPAATSHNDWGLEIQDQIEDVLKENPLAYGHVKFVRPDKGEESVALHIFETLDATHVVNTAVLGFTHGHQASNPDKIGQWWAGQSHGRRPTAMADILVTGHWHSLRVQHSGDARWIIVAPTSDPGSSWFTNKTGENSQSGMLSFELDGANWKDLRIN